MDFRNDAVKKEKVPFLFLLSSSEVVTSPAQDVSTIHESLPWAVPRDIVHSAMMNSSRRTDVNQETTDDE